MSDPINDFLVVHLLPTALLKPHEKYCANNLQYWLRHIVNEQYWVHPIMVDKDTKIIMDGHHRYQIAKILGLKYIPCVLTSYTNPYLKVYSYKDNTAIDNQLIIEAGQSGQLFDHKSTRHTLEINCIPRVNIPLNLITKERARNKSYNFLEDRCAQGSAHRSHEQIRLEESCKTYFVHVPNEGYN